jgi:beta-lactam-binding protein with PASTA domain
MRSRRGSSAAPRTRLRSLRSDVCGFQHRMNDVRAKPLLLVLAIFALAGCGSSGGPRSVAVPRLGHRSLEQGFALLRSRGLRVSLDGATLNPWLPDAIAKEIPSAGTRLPPGSIVTIVPQFGPSASPVYGPASKPYRVPDFVDRSAAPAMRWAHRHVPWSVGLPRLEGSSAPNLFAAYVVTAQRPAAGSRVTPNDWLSLTVRPRR